MNRTSERFRPFHGRESEAQRLTIEVGSSRIMSQPIRWRRSLAERLWDHLGVRVVISADSNAAVQKVKNDHTRNSGRPLLLRDYLLEAADNDGLVAPQPDSFDLGDIGQEARACVNDAFHNSAMVKGNNRQVSNAIYLDSEGKLVMPISRHIEAQGNPAHLPRKSTLILSIYGYSHLKSPSPEVLVPLVKSPDKHEAAVGVLIATPRTQTLLLRTKETPAIEVVELTKPPSVRLPAGFAEKAREYFQRGYEELSDSAVLLDIAARYNLAIYRCSIQNNIARPESL